MPTSGTYDFNLDFLDIVETAYNHAGMEAKTGYDLRQARIELNLLLLEWANEGIHLWTVEEATLPLIVGQNTYTLPPHFLDILDAVRREPTGVDLPLDRYSLQEYLQLPDKDRRSMVSGYVTYRNVGPITLKTWATPERADTIVYYGIRFLQDVGAYTNNMDVPRRFLPALVEGLSYRLLCALPDPTDPEQARVRFSKKADLERKAAMLFAKAKDEDRERSPLIITPPGWGGSRGRR